MKQIKEYCGVIGIAGHPEAAQLAYLGLYALQHRGQEGAGVVSCENGLVYRHVGQGLVNDVFSSPKIFKKLKGSRAIGHNRYSTTGTDRKENVQPLLVNTKSGFVALGHNGNLVNSIQLRSYLQNRGAIFQTTTDSELILHLIAHSKEKDSISQIKDALSRIRGAFSLIMLIQGRVIAARDPNGFRPLALGRLENGHVIASETCAMDLIGAEYIRDVEPGELVIIDKEGTVTSEYFCEKGQSTHCIFEFIYFSRPDSRIFGEYVDKTRRKLGRRLAQEHPADADIVISVPDSSNTAALGYANASGIPFEIGLIRNHYIGRTFIQPQQSIRNFNVKVKFNTVGGVLKNKRVVVVEDSIVRGTTLRMLTQQIRNAGAKEVHVRVSSPPIRFPCYYGMDFPTVEELIATDKSVEEIRQYLGVDSLGYLSIEGLKESVPSEGRGYCTACFNGSYPVAVETEFQKEQYE